MKFDHLCVLAMLFCCLQMARPVVAKAELYVPPKAWTGENGNPVSVDGKPMWQVGHVWPDDLTKAENYLPLTWEKNEWKSTVPESSQGSAPRVTVGDDGVTLDVRGAWSGRPGRKMASITFIAPQPGYYLPAGTMLSKGHGKGNVQMALVKLAPTGVENITDFELGDQPALLDVKPVEMKAGDRLAFVAVMYNDNNTAVVTLKSFNIQTVPAPVARTVPEGVVPDMATKPGDSVFPADSGVVDVKRDHGAKGDGIADDTAAIQAALATKAKIVYLPAGKYVVSDTLRWGEKEKRQILQGQGQGRTVIKLADATPGYRDENYPKSVIWTGRKPAQRFRNGIRDLTVDTGTGNGGAIGMQFIANNQGGIHDVTIVSGDGKGAIGLDLGYTDEQGPCLIRGVTVRGFNVGISNKHAVDSTTFEDVLLEGQKQVGLLNDGQCLSIRKLTSRNDVPAIINKKGPGLIALIDSDFQTLTAGAGEAAIVNEAAMFIRNVRTNGYAMALRDAASGDQAPKALVNQEFVTPRDYKAFDSSMKSLGLPIEETPRVAWGDPATDWVSVKAFQPKEVMVTLSNGKKRKALDWTDAVQQAMNAGKATVYFPTDSYTVVDSVTIPGHVKHIIGMESGFTTESKCDFIVQPGESPLLIERFDWMYAGATVRHDSSRTVVLSSLIGGGYQTNEKSGNLFMEDVCQGPHVYQKQQKIWARQYNNEHQTVKVINDGASYWVLGFKGEGDGCYVHTKNGGKTEITGGFAYANSGRPKEPMFINENSTVSFTIGEWVIRNSPFERVIVESDGKREVVRTRADFIARGGGSMVPLFVSDKAALTPPK